MSRGLAMTLATLLVTAVILVAEYLTADQGVAEPTRVTVARVVDGDTIRVRDLTGHEFPVRVIGIDTPETRHPTLGEQCYGPEATTFTERFLAAGAVRLVYDPRVDPEDKYGRTLAYVERDGADLGEAAIRAGVARERDYDERYGRQQDYQRAQRRAERDGNGLWGACPRETGESR